MVAGLVLATVFLSGCSDPMDVELPEKAGDFKEFQAKIEELDGEDKRLINEFIGENFLAMSVGNIPSGMTVGDAIAMQKEQEEAAKAKQIALQKSIDALNAAVKVEYVDRYKFSNLGFTGYQFTLELTNKSDKTITGVKGKLLFKDTFGEDVGKISVEGEKNILENESRYLEVRTVPSVTQGDFFKDAEYKPKDIRFEPEMIVFEDGSSLSLKES